MSEISRALSMMEMSIETEEKLIGRMEQLKYAISQCETQIKNCCIDLDVVEDQYNDAVKRTAKYKEEAHDEGYDIPTIERYVMMARKSHKF